LHISFLAGKYPVLYKKDLHSLLPSIRLCIKKRREMLLFFYIFTCLTQALYAEEEARMMPEPLTHVEQLFPWIEGKKIALFLDYDGTLTPIVARPDFAVLNQEQRETLTHLAQVFPLAIISGRDRKDVEKLVALEEGVYAGSHGFEIKGPGFYFENGEAASYRADIQEAAALLRSDLADIEGALVEEKRFAVAAHYRLVQEQDIPRLIERFEKVQARFPSLHPKKGKKVIELLPAIVWNKGKALEWLIDCLGCQEHVPIYIGDDTTDEDAFFVLREKGIGICVMDTPKETFARFSLKDPEEVYRFFDLLAKHPLAKKEKAGRRGCKAQYQ
jgi:trehalose 6-phosphate phosphatase